MDAEINNQAGQFGNRLWGYPHVNEADGSTFVNRMTINDGAYVPGYRGGPTDNPANIITTNHRDNIDDLDKVLNKASVDVDFGSVSANLEGFSKPLLRDPFSGPLKRDPFSGPLKRDPFSGPLKRDPFVTETSIRNNVDEPEDEPTKIDSTLSPTITYPEYDWSKIFMILLWVIVGMALGVAYMKYYDAPYPVVAIQSK